MDKRIANLSMSGVLALGLALSGAAFAQQDNATQQQGTDQTQGMGHHGQGRMTPDERLAHMTKRYTLTSDQQTQIKPILENEQQQMQALHQDNSGSRQDRMSKMMSIRQDSNSKIEAILTGDQKQKFEADQQRMQSRMEERMQNHGANNGTNGSGQSNGSTTQPQ